MAARSWITLREIIFRRMRFLRKLREQFRGLSQQRGSPSRIYWLYQKASDLSGKAREEFLDALRRDDESEYREILSLLETDGPPDVIPKAGFPQPLLKPGDMLGRYEILEFIERGGMGEVYKVSHPELGVRVMKILSRELAENAALIERLRLEAKAAAALNHRNIVTVHDFDQQGHLHYIVMEFVEGQSLRKMIGNLSAREAVDYARQMAEGLSFAHDKGIVHRDIKPENVMVRPDGNVKILDFGLAKPVHLAAEAGAADGARFAPASMKTDPQALMGTLRYMAPEQMDYKGASARSDIWSWGVTLYEMLAGRRPFEASTESEVIEAIQQRAPGPPSRYRELNRIVMKALRKRPEERYRLMAEAAEALKNFTIPNWTRRIALLALLASIVIAVYLEIDASRNPHLQMVGQPVALPEQGGHAALPAISPGKKYMAYTDEDHGASVLRLVEIVDDAMVGDRIIARSRDATFKGSVFAPNDDRTIYVLLQGVNGVGVIYRIRLASAAASGRTGDTPASEGGSRWRSTNLLLSFSGDQEPCQDSSPDVASLAWYRRASDSGTFEPVCPNQPQGNKLAPEASVDSPLSFSPDGKYFVFYWIEKTLRTLFVGRTEGGPESHLTPEKIPPYPYLNPLWSPDGRDILTITRVSDHSTVCRTRLENGRKTGAPRCKQFHALFRGKPAWINNGRSIVVSASYSGVRKPQLRRISMDGGLQEAITFADVFSYPSDLDSITCPQGLLHANCQQELIATSVDDRTALWIEDIEEGQLNGATLHRVTKERENLYGITWRDNHNLISESESEKGPNLRLINDGSSPGDQAPGFITEDEKTEYDPVVSPDGRYLVYASNLKGGIHLWRADPAKPKAVPTQLTFIAQSAESQPSISSDSQWVIFTSEESGGQTLKKIPIQGGDPISIEANAPANLARNASVSADGSRILCEYLDRSVEPSGWKWTVALLDGNGKFIESFSDLEIGTPVRLSKDGKSILYVKKENGTQNVWSKAIEDGGHDGQVTHLGKERIFAFALSPDGKRIAYLSGPKPTSQIVRMQVAK